MRNKNFWFVMLTVVTLLMWTAPMFTTPTFDLDEALYRQSAQEMKQSHSYFKITWSGEPFYEKPPLHMWSIVAVSKLIDQDNNKVSVLASKIPSTLSTFLMVLMACLFWKKAYPILKSRSKKAGLFPHFQEEFLSFPFLPALFLGWAILPTAGSSSVIIDPMLLMAFSPFFLMMTFFYLKHEGNHQKIHISAKFFMGLSLAAATMLKGPIGLVLPAFSIGIQEFLLFIFKNREASVSFAHELKDFMYRLWLCFKSFFFPFFVGLIFSGIYYWFIYLYGGYDFIYEFFVVQNFQRGTRPFESHGGTIFYHWIVVFLGGLFLTPTLLILLKKCFSKKVRSLFVLWGYPLSWCLGFLIFFSLMSTKLPNYTWPVWVGLCTMAPILLCLVGNWKLQKKSSFILLYFFPILLTVCLLAVANTIIPLFHYLKLDPRVYIVMKTILPLPLSVQIGFLWGGLCLGLALYFCYQWLYSPKSTLRSFIVVSFLNSVFILILCVSVVPFIKNVYWLPFVRSSEYAQKQIEIHGGTFATMGLNSPTVSSSFTLSYVHQYTKNDDGAFHNKITYLLLPKWLEPKCGQYGYKIIRQDYYLTVCQKGT